MFLGAYHFDGDPAVQLAGYRRLMAGFPPDSFRTAIADAGLAAPRVEPLGEVRTARLRSGIEA